MTSSVFVASAPNKIQLAGEHSVVYGGIALMAPVEINGRRNTIRLTVTEGKPGGEEFIFTGDLGTSSFRPDRPDQGFELYFPILEGARYAFKQAGFAFQGSGIKFRAELEYSGSPKGTGNSASIPAALTAGLYTYFGKKFTKQELFDAAYFVDNIYHGGKSSGGDPRAVVSDSPLQFKKIFYDNKESFDYKDVVLTMPTGTRLVLVDSFREGERASTNAQIAKFADSKGVKKPPNLLSNSERDAIAAPFNSVLHRLMREFTPTGNPATIGQLMDENHGLLRAANVTSPDIEECIKLSKKTGAYGGKLIGAGGNGGAVIIYCANNKLDSIRESLKAEGFATYPLVFSTRGACAQP